MNSYGIDGLVKRVRLTQVRELFRGSFLLALVSLAFYAIYAPPARGEPTSYQSVQSAAPTAMQPEPMRIPAAAKSGEQWQAGLHYSVLIGKAPTSVATGRVEVLELFMYTSPLSYQIQQHLRRWLKSKPGYIEYVRRPSIVFPHARIQARMFFALQQLGRDDLHDAYFFWIFEKDHYPIYHTIMHPDEIGYGKLNMQFVEKNGIDRAKFSEIYASNSLDERIIQTEIDTHGYLVSGTSTFVVGGRYSTSIQRLIYPKSAPDDGDYARLFRLLEYLAASEIPE